MSLYRNQNTFDQTFDNLYPISTIVFSNLSTWALLPAPVKLSLCGLGFGFGFATRTVFVSGTVTFWGHIQRKIPTSLQAENPWETVNIQPRS